MIFIGLVIAAVVLDPSNVEPAELSRPSKPASIKHATVMVSDYPRKAVKAGEVGYVVVRYVIGTNGKVSDCAIRHSSNSAALDEKSCAIIKRWRYLPALDAAGTKIPDTREQHFGWQIVGRGGCSDHRPATTMPSTEVICITAAAR